MSKTSNPPPNITVTRDDVLALPLRMNLVFRSAEPRGGHVWSLVRLTASLARAAWQIDRLTWVEHPEAESSSSPKARVLREDECEVAERAAVWQNMLAGAAFLEDAERDNVTEIRTVIRATMAEETRDAIRRLVGTGGVKA